ncbi:cation acetate symporter, partial [candidate division KSB1 bacterium]|nr:cation acetate symporter [candidate division KSB1 bacterium]
EGAIAGMVTGILFTAGYIIYFKFINPEANSSENWLLGISPEGIGIIGMFLNASVALLVSKMTPAPPEEVQKMIEDIRIPESMDGTV